MQLYTLLTFEKKSGYRAQCMNTEEKKLSYTTPLEDSRNVMLLFLTDNAIGGGTDSKQII